jgi:hypothetical protein
MPVYPYDCCGNQHNTIADRDTCPGCGKEGTRNFAEQINSDFDQQHGRKWSVHGDRNYWDEGAGRFFGSSESRKAWLRENGYRPAKNASMYETW